MADTPTEDVNLDEAMATELSEMVEDQETTPAESSTEENKPDVEIETEGEPSDKDTEETPEDKPEDPAEETEQPQGKAEERKQQLNGEIRDLVSQRNELKAEVEKINAQIYQPATEEELKEQGMSPEMAAIEAMKQEREMERYNNQVAEAQLTIDSEAGRVVNDFPIFNPDSPEFNKELAAEAAQLLDQNLIRDPNSGQITGSNLSPYQLYKTLASAHTSSAAQGQIKGQKATEQMLASADIKGSAAPKPVVKDPILAVLEDVDSI